jgi:hypothetical protein
VAAATLIGWYLFRPERAVLNRSANEPAPAGVAVVLRTGRFESRAHQGSGVAQVLKLAGGQRVLRLSDFATSDGPDLHVYLLGSARAAGRPDLEAGGYLSLGALKGNRGSQNYVIPPGTDLDRFPAVAIWCRRFGVNFTTATLVALQPGS